MKRTVLHELKKWKSDTRHKPLLIRGARQVGKTYILKESGKINLQFTKKIETNKF